MHDPQDTPRLLVVDDEPHVCRILERWITGFGYECLSVESAESACERLREDGIALVVCDITMPGMSGIDLLSKARTEFPDTAFIMATAVDERATAIHALELGAYGYMRKPFDQNEVAINIANALERQRLRRESRQYEERLEGEVRERTKDVRRRESEIVMRLIRAAEYRDDATGAHIRRIGLFSAILAEEAGWEPGKVNDLRMAAPMHDVGKVGVADAILLKPDRLTPQEFEVIKTHTTIGGDILGGSSIPLLILARNIALCHHERWDGTGYPNGLAGEAIPECARIVALADVYDALVNDRVYRPAMPVDGAVDIMTKAGGTHFDPRLLGCFLRILPQFAELNDAVLEVDLAAGTPTPPSDTANAGLRNGTTP